MYVESLPPAEREMYLAYAKTEETQRAQENKPKDMLMGTPIDPNMNPLNAPNN